MDSAYGLSCIFVDRFYWGSEVAYNFNLTGNATQETVVLNSSSPNSYCYLMFYELSSTGTFTLDTTGGATDSASSTSLAGVALTLSSSSDFIAQAFRFTAGYSTSISTPYTQAGSGSGPAYGRFVYTTNATSGAAPILTDNRSAIAAVGAIAISTHSAGGAPQASIPVCTPGTGTYYNTQSVSCTNPGSAPALCYTTNGTTPATNGLSGCTTGTVVSGTISVTPTSGGTVLKVVAGGTGFLDSLVVSNTYTLPVATTPAGTPATCPS